MGSTPDPAGGSHRAPRDTLAVFKGPNSDGRGRREENVGK